MAGRPKWGILKPGTFHWALWWVLHKVPEEDVRVKPKYVEIVRKARRLWEKDESRFWSTYMWHEQGVAKRTGRWNPPKPKDDVDVRVAALESAVPEPEVDEGYRVLMEEEERHG